MEPTELEQRLMDGEPVTITLAPGTDGDPIKVTMDFGKYGEVATNPYQRIAKGFMEFIGLAWEMSNE